MQVSWKLDNREQDYTARSSQFRWEKRTIHRNGFKGLNVHKWQVVALLNGNVEKFGRVEAAFCRCRSTGTMILGESTAVKILFGQAVYLKRENDSTCRGRRKCAKEVKRLSRGRECAQASTLLLPLTNPLQPLSGYPLTISRNLNPTRTMAASRAMYSAQITCHAINCNRLIRNALPYPTDTPSLPRNFDANKYCSVACAGRGTQRICALSSCQQQAVATISCPHCRGMPQTDPDTVFPNYGYCTKEHLDQDARDHQEGCTQRRDAAWLRFVDDAVNAACHEERKALYARVVTGDPYVLDKDYVFFSQRSANQSGERGMMFPSNMRECDRQSVLFFHACRCTIRITTYMVAFLSQGTILCHQLKESH